MGEVGCEQMAAKGDVIQDHVYSRGTYPAISANSTVQSGNKSAMGAPA